MPPNMESDQNACFICVYNLKYASYGETCTLNANNTSDSRRLENTTMYNKANHLLVWQPVQYAFLNMYKFMSALFEYSNPLTSKDFKILNYPV